MLKKLELNGFKSFAKKSEFVFDAPITSIVGPNGSGKSNVVESIRFVLGEQSSKSLRSKSGADIPFAGSKMLPKMNRAKVAITFDNKNRVFQLTNAKNEKVSVDFDEIEISREVFSDGSNTYAINGNEVRLRDIHELIAGVNIGASGHHIISQGEADRLLNANARERREMIEEALGLKMYHFRIKESEKKLEKTRLNLHETASLRREITPHLKYLEKQVEKIQQAESLRNELQEKFSTYISRQESYLGARQAVLDTKRRALESELETLEEQVAHIRTAINTPDTTSEDEDLRNIAEQERVLRTNRDELSRSLGKIDAMIDMARRPVSKKDVVIAVEDIRAFGTDVLRDLESLLLLDEMSAIRNATESLRDNVLQFIKRYTSEEGSEKPQQAEVDAFEKSRDDVLGEMRSVDERIALLGKEAGAIRAEIQQKTAQARLQEREYFELKSNVNAKQSALSVLAVERDAFQKDNEKLAQDLAEARMLFGEEFSYAQATEEHGPQDILRREIDRILIRLEDMGGGSGADTIREFEDMQERDQFLQKETSDLEASMASIEEVIAELKQQLAKEFEQGIGKINTQFNEFFTVLFGGGKASLAIVEIKKRRKTDDVEVEEEGESESGIDIAVSLPRKKVQDLDMLSGGERSLTSIALLFALSQVNPPPFLVLDETDAALDEANSARYGDMLEQLSKYSQLIVVTHNRETMSRADILYGVTMGSLECSQLLSVKFDEAMQYAK